LTGIYAASFIKPFLAKDFISNMKDDQLSQWRGKFGKSASRALQEFAVEYVGKPIDYMLRCGCLFTTYIILASKTKYCVLSCFCGSFKPVV